MAYVGQQIPIPLGTVGLKTDDASTQLPPNAAITANNISFYTGNIAKSGASLVYNLGHALDAPIVALWDYFPIPTLQRLIAVTSNGKIWRDTGDGTFTSTTPIKTGLSALSTDTTIAEGGAESAGRNKKLFIFTGASQVQVINGDGTTTADIANPAADWSASFPTGGLVHAGRMAAFGNSSSRHTLYLSKLADQEDFRTAVNADTAVLFPVYPGEGDGIVAICEYQSRLFIFKRPFGVYYLDDSAGPDFTTWAIRKLTSAWGIASPHGALQVLQDLIGANTTGSYTSLQATNAFGDVTAGDILALNKLENYIRSQFTKAGITATQSIYYSEKKQVMFSARSQGGTVQDRLLMIDISNQTPRFSIENKDAPNCLALRKDINAIPRPVYGDVNGLVFQMDQSGFNVNGQPYLAEFQTPYTDLSWVDGSLAGKCKIFDFVEINYVPLGDWAFYIDVYVDGIFKETVTINQKNSGAVLGSFQLNVDRLSSAAVAKPARKSLHCTGRTISFRIYNGGLDQDFKVDRLIVCFRLSAEQQSE